MTKKSKKKNGNKKPVKKQQKKEGIEQKSIPDGIHKYIIIPMLLMIHLIKQEVCDIIGLLKGVKPKQGLQIGCIANHFCEVQADKSIINAIRYVYFFMVDEIIDFLLET